MELTKEDVKQAHLEALRQHDREVRRANTCPICCRSDKPIFYVAGKGMVCIKCWLDYGGK